MPRFDLSNYVDVQTRLNRFHLEYPDGRIATMLESDPNDREHAVFVAHVYKHRDHAFPDATGWAQEVKGPNGANLTSHVENAETSAIGRALANLGYATSLKDRPSREEMAKVERLSAPEPQGRRLRSVADPDPEPVADPVAVRAMARFGKDPDDLTATEKRMLSQWAARHEEPYWADLLPLLERMTAVTTRAELDAVAADLTTSEHQFLQDRDVIESGKLARARVEEVA